ncbi:MAG: class I SAM-dependent methyltransferase [Planctomycetota bacterium]|jgi:SAM-dependent methyltransferase
MTDAPNRDARGARIAALGFDYSSQPVQARTSCNLCGGERFVGVTHRDRYAYPAAADGCLRCGLVFLNPVMTSEAYAGFYRDVYRPLVSAYHGRRIDAETIQDEQKDYAAALAGLLEPCLAARSVKTLLDVGGSTGVVAHHLKERFDLAATVIDPAPLEIDVARRLGLQTVTGFVEDHDPGGSRYDLITLCQTVDHLLDVSVSLRKIRALVSEDGLFFVDIVDFRAAYRRNGSVEEAIKIDHPFYLVEETMRAFLRRSGFEILRVDYAADHLHVGYVCAPADSEPEFLPAADAVAAQWREIRSIQNRVP